VWGSVVSPLPKDSHASLVQAMQEVPVGLMQLDRGGSSSWGCILLVADFESWSERKEAVV